MSTAIEAVNLGAYRYVVKTDTLVEELSLTVARALEGLALRQENLRLPLAQIPESVTGIAATGTEAIHIPPEGINFESQISQMEKQYLQAALQSAGGERRKAAALLKCRTNRFAITRRNMGSDGQSVGEKRKVDSSTYSDNLSQRAALSRHARLPLARRCQKPLGSALAAFLAKPDNFSSPAASAVLPFAD